MRGAYLRACLSSHRIRPQTRRSGDGGCREKGDCKTATMADSRADELPTDGNTVSQSAKDGGDNAGIPIIGTYSRRWSTIPVQLLDSDRHQSVERLNM